jgi:hypothetical protein
MAKGPYSLIDEKIRLFKIDNEKIQWNDIADSYIMATYFYTFKTIIRHEADSGGNDTGNIDIDFGLWSNFETEELIFIFIDNTGRIAGFTENSPMNDSSELIYES